MKNIAFAFSDDGAYENVNPVRLELLKNQNILTCGIVSGRALERNINSGLFFFADNVIDYKTNIKTFCKFFSGIDALVLGVSQGSSLEFELVKALKGICPIYVLPDAWTSFSAPGFWKNGYNLPDYVLVNDDLGEIGARYWGFNGEVKVLGSPTFDAYFKINKFKKMKLDLPLVLFIGQGTGESGDIPILRDLVNILNDEFFKEVFFYPKEHPRMRSELFSESREWDNIVNTFKDKNRLLVGNDYNLDDMLFSSKVVISDFSTVLNKAVLLRKDIISIAYPDLEIVKGYFSRHTWTNGVFPLVSLNCALEAKSKNELCMLIKRSMEDGFGLEDNQRQYFTTDGKNSERVANFILETISAV